MNRREPIAWMVYTVDGQSAYVTDNPSDIKEGQSAYALYPGPFEQILLTDEVDAAVRAEREACAKLAESIVCDTHLPTGVRIYGTRVADAIRARKD